MHDSSRPRPNRAAESRQPRSIKEKKREKASQISKEDQHALRAVAP